MDLQIELPPMDESLLTLYPQLATGPADAIVYEPCGPIGLCESLLYYDETGTLRGIASFFPNDGNANIFVEPSHQRKGIGMKLAREGLKRWPIDFSQQVYTEKGAAFVKSVLERNGTSHTVKAHVTRPEEPALPTDASAKLDERETRLV